MTHLYSKFYECLWVAKKQFIADLCWVYAGNFITRCFIIENKFTHCIVLISERWAHFRSSVYSLGLIMAFISWYGVMLNGRHCIIFFFDFFSSVLIFWSLHVHQMHTKYKRKKKTKKNLVFKKSIQCMWIFTELQSCKRNTK